jgi:hypothetical protein
VQADIPAKPGNFAAFIDAGGAGDAGAVGDATDAGDAQSKATAEAAAIAGAETGVEQEAKAADDPATALEELKKLKALIDAEELAETLYTKRVKVKPNGEERVITVREAMDGYMRNADYSRSKQELRLKQQQIDDFVDNFDGMIASWKEPGNFRSGLRRLGLEQAFIEAARMLGREMLEEQQLTPHEREMRARMRAIEEQNRVLQEQLHGHRGQEQTAAAKRRQAELASKLDQLVPPAMKTHNITDSPIARQVYSQNLQALWEPGMELTADIANQAAAATAEQLADMARAYAAAQTAPASAPVAPPVGTAQRAPAALPAKAATGAAGARPATPQGGTLADFEAHLRKLRSR